MKGIAVMDKKTILEKHVRDGDLYFKWLRGHGEGFNRKLYPPGDGEFASGSLILPSASIRVN